MGRTLLEDHTEDAAVAGASTQPGQASPVGSEPASVRSMFLLVAGYLACMAALLFGVLLTTHFALSVIGRLEPGAPGGGPSVKVAWWVLDNVLGNGVHHLLYLVVLGSVAYFCAWHFRIRRGLGWLDSGMRMAPLLVLVSLGLQAAWDVEPHHDSWAYHLPFAARMWGLVSNQHWVWSEGMEAWYSGFPLLIEWLQGLLWWGTGRVENANLVCFGFLCVYLLFLRRYFAVPVWLSTAGLLAVPFIQIHATSCYVDLPGNLCLAALIMILFGLESQRLTMSRKVVWMVLVCAGIALNSKHILGPVAFLLLGIFAWRHWRFLASWFGTKSISGRWAWAGTAVLALGLVFATPVKNMLVHQNPLYPFGIRVLGKELKGYEVPLSALVEEKSLPSRVAKWGRSVLEIGVPLGRWSVDAYHPNPVLFRLGGYFGPYVAFNIALLAFLIWRRRDRDSVVAGISVGIAASIAAVMPNSHKLRYYMFWIILLVSLNLYLTCGDKSVRVWRGFRAGHLAKMGVLSAFVAVIVLTKGKHIRPHFYGAGDLITRHVHVESLARLKTGEVGVLTGAEPWVMLYTAPFHDRDDYRVTSGTHTETTTAK